LKLYKHIAFWLACLTTLHATLPVGITLVFHWQQDYITANHCINIDKPELNCNGQCFFSEKLAQALGLEQEKPAQQAPTLRADFNKFVAPQAKARMALVVGANHNSFGLAAALPLLQGHSSAVFIPPQAHYTI